MKKEYIILIVVIAGLCAYLALKKDNRINYELPTLASIDAKAVDTIEITKGKNTITLSRADKGWTVTKKAYPVDQSAVADALDTIKGLTLSALASETQDLVRYDLDTGNAIQVTASGKGKVIRQFTIGKIAPSFNHTFVMVADDARIFQADKNFRNDFDKRVDEFRDKVVLRFKTDEIKTITLEKDGIQKTLTLEALAEKKETPVTNGKKADDTAPALRWQDPDGTPADQDTVKDLISSLSRLECQTYKDEDQTQALKKKTPTCKITLENDTEFRVNLFSQKKGDDVAGTASSTPYAFDLASYKANDIISYVNKILGLKTEEPTSGKS